MNRRSFITTCASCASLCAFMCYKNKTINNAISSNLNAFNTSKSNTNINNKLKKFIHFGIHVTEHCNLGCKYCNHFSCIADEEYYDVEKFENDMKRLSEVKGVGSPHINFLGGEPLLHPKINDFFSISKKYFPHSKKKITTNCVLLDSKDESFWKSMNENIIHLLPSMYPIDINWKSIYAKTDRYGIHIEKTGPVEVFYKLKLDLAGKQDENAFCDVRGVNNRYINGKLYPCFVISNIRHFNKKFNQNIPVTEEDYLDIYKVKDVREIIDFLNKPKPFCKYCAQICEKFVPWENSKTHDIKEWT